MESTEKKRSEIALKKAEMDAEAETLFKSWNDSAAAISDTNLRQRADERLSKTKAQLRRDRHSRVECGGALQASDEGIGGPGHLPGT